MLHDQRVWCVSDVGSAEQLAGMVTETRWCCCSAFRIGEYAWLNDSTSPDGAQEYAVVKLADTANQSLQIESITFGWCDYEKALGFIRATLAGEDDQNDFAQPVSPVLQGPESHDRCRHCAGNSGHDPRIHHDAGISCIFLDTDRASICVRFRDRLC